MSGREARRVGWRRCVAWCACVAGAVLALASCGGDAEPSYEPIGSGPENALGDEVCTGPTCPAACAKAPVPGCACEVEGAHLRCQGKAVYPAEGTSPGAVECSPGWSVCTDGVWGPCWILGV